MSLFIKSSEQTISLMARVGALNNIQEYAIKLVRIAELAYGRRDLDTIEKASQELLSLPTEKAQSTGLYFLAMLAKRQGFITEARAMLNAVRGTHEARAIQALGVIELENGRFDEAVKLNIESIKANQQKDIFVITGVQCQLSVIKSLHGDHNHALDDLLSLWSMVRIAAKQHPYLWPALHNEIACEMLELGHIEKAAHASSIALASPYAFAYPEWHETSAEIRMRGQRASHSRVFIGRLVEVEKAVGVSAEMGKLLPHDFSVNDRVPNSTPGNPAVVETMADYMARTNKKSKNKPEKANFPEKLQRIDREELQNEILNKVINRAASADDLRDFLEYLEKREALIKKGK